MFVTAQPWQKDEDYVRLIQDLRPPPPPGDENIWELHFCKWWGWNWVKRKDIAEAPLQRQVEAPLQSSVHNAGPSKVKHGSRKKHENKLEKKPEKKPIKHLCRTLCFKNTKKQQQPLQNMYNTPSNSVIEDTKTEKNTAPIMYNPPNPGQAQNDHLNSTIQREIEELVTKEIRNQAYAPPKVQTQKTKRVQNTSSSSSDECICCCGDRSESSRERCVEYINIARCPCCHPSHHQEAPMSKKQMSTSYTQPPPPPQSKITSTQTEQKSKKEEQRKCRRRHICVVCCSCGQSVPPRCCSCHKNSRHEERSEKKGHGHHSLEEASDTNGKGTHFYKTEAHKSDKGSTNKYSQAYNVLTTEQSSPFTRKPPQATNLNKKLDPVYKAGMPLDMMLLCDYNKPIAKFGMPSQNYSWIHATKSDIWDQLFHLRTSHEFSSPVSGNTYNISPKKVSSAGPEPSVLLNPLSVDEELLSLKKIENEVKMDLKSRIMLDAVCDAILSRDKDVSRNSSILLNELTYPSSITQTESYINDLYKSEKKHTSSKLNQTQTTNDIIFENVIKECNTKNKNVNQANTAEVTPSLSSQANKSFSEFARVRSPRTYSIENSFMRVAPKSSFSFNYNTYQNDFKAKKENNPPYKLADLVINKNPSLVAMTGQSTLNSRTKLMSAYKRSASPPPGQSIKKPKLKEPTPLTPLENRNISDIFKKIDEIVLRSKVNNQEIQNVLKAIPKKTFQFFTSWEVSNVTSQTPSMQIKEQDGASTSSMNTVVIEERNDQKDRMKIPAAKKKKVTSRPSLIPKRVADAKLNKK